jgi:hypothetical protein
MNDKAPTVRIKVTRPFFIGTARVEVGAIVDISALDALTVVPLKAELVKPELAREVIKKAVDNATAQALAIARQNQPAQFLPRVVYGGSMH